MRKDLRSTIFIGALLAATSCTPSHLSSYTVSARNISPNGEYGVILIDFPAKQKSDAKDEGQQPNQIYLYPWVDRRMFYAFDTSQADLPNQVQLKWQLANLTNCKSENKYATPPGHVRKRFCQWHPVDDTLTQKTIDLTKAKESKAFRLKGESRGSNLTQKTAHLTLVFVNEKLEVSVEAGATNPWR